jgi:hypothetical protein
MWGNKVPMQYYPDLYSFAKSKTLTLEAAKNCPSLISLLHLPLSTQAFA